ncbi:MAG: VOC family protein [Nitrososphaerota archaeon]|jgi:predicted enzyme related to lactoylglutathione lyase|nr:VOC family protein [Nitrososphaerota archaeon]
MIKKISSFAVVVRDEKKSAKWFKDKLGFQIESSKGHWVTVVPKGTKGPLLHLCKTTPLEKGNTGIAFLTDDLQKEYENLSRKGVKFTVKPRDDGWGMYSMFRDIDGNIFWLLPN